MTDTLEKCIPICEASPAPFQHQLHDGPIAGSARKREPLCASGLRAADASCSNRSSSYSADPAMRKRYDSIRYDNVVTLPCRCSPVQYLSVWMSCVRLDSFWYLESWKSEYYWSIIGVRGQPISWHPRCSASAIVSWGRSWLASLSSSPTVLLEPASRSSEPPIPSQAPGMFVHPTHLSRTAIPMCLKHFGSYCIHRMHPLRGKRGPSGSGHWAEGEDWCVTRGAFLSRRLLQELELRCRHITWYKITAEPCRCSGMRTGLVVGIAGKPTPLHPKN